MIFGFFTMAITYPTMSLFGFLTTTALGVGLTLLSNKKKIGMYVTAFGAIGSLGMGVIKLINHLCCKKQQPEAINEDQQEPDGDTRINSALLLDSDDDQSVYDQGPFSEVPLIDDIIPEAADDDICAATVKHNPGVLERMGAALSNIVSRKDPAKQL